MPPDGITTSSFKLTDRQYEKLSRLIYDHGGIHLGDNKKELVHARLNKILRRRNIGGFDDYIRILQNDDSGNELVLLLDAISTNVTHFFREHQHFEFLRANLPDSAAEKGVRIWSAGCSSGEEPYSLAITLREHFPAPLRGVHSILATDISTKVLQRAVNGIYPMKTVQNIDMSLLRKYFLKGKGQNDGTVKIKREVSSLVTFQRLNLIEPFHFDQKFDVIFCRNVMIYFDTPTRQKLTDRFYDSLEPGGYLIIGHSESMNAFKHQYKYIQPTIYRKI